MYYFSVCIESRTDVAGRKPGGKLVLLKFGDKLLVLLMGELAGVVFKDSLGSFATGRVE